MPLEKGFDLHEEVDNTYVEALDSPEAQAQKAIDEENERKKRPLRQDELACEILKEEERKLVKVFSKDGCYINLNNFVKRTNFIARRRAQLLRLINAYAIKEAASAGKKRYDFASFKAAVAMLPAYINGNNIVVGRNDRDYLNTDRLKELLATEDFNMSKITSEFFIRCAKKAKILKKIGKGKECKYMLNPAIHSNAYLMRISTEVFYEFPVESQLYFNAKQYDYVLHIIRDKKTPEEAKRLEEGFAYERK